EFDPPPDVDSDSDSDAIPEIGGASADENAAPKQHNIDDVKSWRPAPKVGGKGDAKKSGSEGAVAPIVKPNFQPGERWGGIGLVLEARPLSKIKGEGSAEWGAVVEEWDVLLSVDATPVLDTPIASIARLILGPLGSRVRLELRRGKVSYKADVILGVIGGQTVDPAEATYKADVIRGAIGGQTVDPAEVLDASTTPPQKKVTPATPTT
ncbi:hypothetical protein T484DRAFT_1798103, partial [Baffinella frigidus]